MIPGSNKKHPRFKQSFGYAVKGIVFALKTERNLKIMIVAFVAALILSFVLGLSPAEICIILVGGGAVLSAELVNTALEACVDLIMPRLNEKAGTIKDLAAGAVLVLSCIMALVGIVLFGHAIMRILTP